MKNCMGIQKSLDWCEETPEPAGIRREGFYVSMGDVVGHPKVPVDELGRPQSAELEGDFTLAADTTFKKIHFIPERSQFTSDPQGEYPNQTQLDKLTMVLPGVGPKETAAAAYINNTRCYFLFQDMKGRWRLVGNPDYPMKATVAQDLGQGVTGQTATTIAVEASNIVSAPFFNGTIVTEDGEIKISDDAAGGDGKQEGQNAP